MRRAASMLAPLVSACGEVVGRTLTLHTRTKGDDGSAQVRRGGHPQQASQGTACTCACAAPVLHHAHTHCCAGIMQYQATAYHRSYRLFPAACVGSSQLSRCHMRACALCAPACPLQLQAMLAAASAASSSPLLGVLPKDKHEGALQATAASVLGASGMATADMSQGIAALFAVKEQPEVS